ncbi:MAG TPA: helix-hairpin-helix domain-containing protein [Candidatus Humimicrobiaceae bacterium]
MNLLDLKEKISRARFFIDKVRYKREKHFYFAIFGLIFCLVSFFTIVYINQQVEIKRKEDILRSYYPENDIERSVSEGSAAKTNEETDGEKKLYENKENSSGENSSQDMESDNDSGNLPQIINTIKAYICGEVRNPGVYEIENGARIIDLLKIAGGQTENSCLEIINLAQVVIDGQRIYIPSREEIGDNDSLFFTEDSEDYGFSDNGPVNINTADSKELETLPGIGPVIANNIIEYRSRNGSFKKKEELKNVTGIGEKKYEEIEKLVSI